MQELTMKLIDVELTDKVIKLILQTEVDGDEYELEKSIRLSVWDEEAKELVEDEATHAAGMATVEEIFGITDTADFADLIGNDYEFFMTEDGVVWFSEPTWYAERKLMDDLFAAVSKPDASLEEKSSKGILEYVHLGKNGITLFIEVTGKAGKGKHVVTNFRYGGYNSDNEFKRDYKKKKKQEAKVKQLFELNDVADLKDLVGETVLIKYESVNGNMFTSCSGLDE